MKKTKAFISLVMCAVLIAAAFSGCASMLLIYSISDLIEEGFASDEFYEGGYTIDDISSMVAPDAEDDVLEALSEENLARFNEILSNIDEIIGKDEYYITSLYEVGYDHYDPDTAVVKVVAKEFYNDYLELAEDYDNPYETLFSKDFGSRFSDVNNFYESLIVGLKYQDDFYDEFNSLGTEYKPCIDYNGIFYRNNRAWRLTKEDDWRDLELSENPSNVCFFVPYGTSESEIQEFYTNNESMFSKYSFNRINAIVVAKDVDFETLKPEEVNPYDETVVHYVISLKQ